VRRSGKRLRITAQLVNVVDGFHLWSERYDREIADIFDIQDEITAAIVKTLEPTLAGQQQALTRRHSENLQAYELYLKGKHFWDQRMESTLRAAVECFRAAISLDPDYALAHAGLADCFSILAIYGYVPPADGKPRAEAAVNKAAELDSSLAEVHFSLGLYHSVFGDRQFAAERHLRRGLEIQPRSSVIHAYLGLLLSTLHRFGEADLEAAKATELDPLSPFVHGIAALASHCARRPREAIRYAERALELQPNFVLGLWPLGVAKLVLRSFQEAIEANERLVSLTRRAAIFVGQLGMVYALAGEREKALVLQKELQDRAANEFVSAIGPLEINLGLGDREAAYADVLAFVNEGITIWGLEATMGPYLDAFEKDPRWAELFQKVGRAPVTE